MEEKRQYVRVPCRGQARIVDGQTEIDGELVDVSIGGACIRTTALLDADKRCKVQLEFGDMPGRNVVAASGTVVRTPTGQVGVRFDGVDNISAGRLFHWMGQNHPDQRKFEQEMVRVRGRGWAAA
jgi:hypothetical protein